MLAAVKNSRRGQAIVELMPSLLLFLMVISAGLTYFRVMRQAAIRQEVVRNMAFAKIGGAGTLTTPSVQVNRGGVFIPELSVPAIPYSAQRDFINQDTGCFYVAPGDSLKSFGTLNINPLIGAAGELSIETYAVIFRQAGSVTCP